MGSAHKHSPRIVVTRTPLRVSFSGALAEIAGFNDPDCEAVLSTTIDKYIYVTVKRHSKLFNEPIRITYSSTELVDTIDRIKNNIARESLRLLKIDPPIYISTVGDLPATTGLGGTSSFAVGLLQALHAFRGERVSPAQLAEEATQVQINLLKKPVHKHDQYAAAFGGLNFFRFNLGGEVTIEPVRARNSFRKELFGHILMFWTGFHHGGGSVLLEHQQNIPANLEHLDKMRAHCHRLHQLTQAGPFDPVAFGRTLDESWQLERQFVNSSSRRRIDASYQSGMQAGAEGGKLCGAGNTGFLLFVIKLEKQPMLRKALSDLLEIPLRFEAHGSRVLLPFEP